MKEIFKKWWFWVLILVAVIGLILISIYASLIFTNPNCGGEKYNYGVEINSKQEFLNLIESWENVSSSQVGQEAFDVIQWFKHKYILEGNHYTLDEVSVREYGFLLFKEKIYSVDTDYSSIGDYPCDITLEISEKGIISFDGCCGI